MASVNEPGLIRVVAERADGTHKVIGQYRSDGPIAAGYSPDGVLANLTADKQLFQPYSGPILRGGDRIHLMFKLDAADGLDVSDGITMLPYWEDGVYRPLNNTDLGNTTDLPAATLAAAWTELGSGYTIPSNVRRARFGNGQIVISIEDDTG